MPEIKFKPEDLKYQALKPEKDAARLVVYQQAVNQIDDFLEYQYQGMTPDQIKTRVMQIIDNLTAKLKRIN